jgi:uncharacterized protein
MGRRLRRATAHSVQDFVRQRTLAFVGVSRNAKKFPNAAYRELRGKGYRLIPVNPAAETVEGETCYPSLTRLPEPVDGAIVMVPPSQAELVVRDAATAGIKRVWLQQGAESEAALKMCELYGIKVVSGECILMFAEPAMWFHRAHRFGRRMLGTLPH